MIWLPEVHSPKQVVTEGWERFQSSQAVYLLTWLQNSQPYPRDVEGFDSHKRRETPEERNEAKDSRETPKGNGGRAAWKLGGKKRKTEIAEANQVQISRETMNSGWKCYQEAEWDASWATSMNLSKRRCASELGRSQFNRTISTEANYTKLRRSRGWRKIISKCSYSPFDRFWNWRWRKKKDISGGKT